VKKFLKSVFTTAFGVFVGIVVSLALIPVVVIVISRSFQGGMEPIEKNSILHVKMKGHVIEHARAFDFDFLSRSPFSEEQKSIGLFETVSAIAIAKTDPRIKGIYLELRDFDSGWAALSSLHRALTDFAKSGKFVYAYADAYDQKSYYLATAANQIYLEPAGELEMKGLGISEPFVKGLLDKLQVEPRIFRVGRFKAAVEPLILDKMSAENRTQNQALLDDVWSTARTAYAAVIKKSPDDVDRAAATLALKTPEDALQMGFVQKLGYEDEVLDLMKEKTVGVGHDLNVVSPMRLFHDQAATVKPAKHKDKIALIFADGDIVSGYGSRNQIGSETLAQDIDDAKEDPDVKAIVLRVNSPGGDALAADVIWRAVSEADEKIPVVVSMGDYAASGGYYISAPARYILAEATTITGSIGVFGVMFNTEKLFKGKLGVNFDRVVTHPYADIGNSNRVMSDSEKQFVQSGVERVYARFVEVVQDGRNFPAAADVEKIAEGRVWSGTRAKAIGLVDEIGGLAQAIQKAAAIAKIKGSSIDIYPKDDDPISRFMERYLGDTMMSVMTKSGFADDLKQWSWLKKNLVDPLPLNSLQNWKSGIYARLPWDLVIR
jgi:protease-4